MTIEPIGIVRSSRVGRRDDHWRSVESMIDLDERFSSDALAGIEARSE